MVSIIMNTKALECIKDYDTPTIIKAIEVALGARDFRNYTKNHL